MARFQVEEEGRPTRSYRLVTDAIIIGRVDTADLVLPDTGVSRKHALVERVRDAWVLTDSGSANGTSVNGAPVEQHPLVSGDVVTIGKFTLTFHDDDHHDLPEYTDPSVGSGDYATSPGVPIGDLDTMRPPEPPVTPEAPPVEPAPAVGPAVLVGKDGERYEVGAGLKFGADVPVAGVLPFVSPGGVEAEGDGATAVKGSFLIPLLVNGKPVGRQRLRDGDQLRVGSSTFTYHGP